MSETPTPTNDFTTEQPEQDLVALRMQAAGLWQADDDSFERIQLLSLRGEER
jgi:hypothetical protein